MWRPDHGAIQPVGNSRKFRTRKKPKGCSPMIGRVVIIRRRPIGQGMIFQPVFRHQIEQALGTDIADFLASSLHRFGCHLIRRCLGPRQHFSCRSSGRMFFLARRPHICAVGLILRLYLGQDKVERYLALRLAPAPQASGRRGIIYVRLVHLHASLRAPKLTEGRQWEIAESKAPIA